MIEKSPVEEFERYYNKIVLPHRAMLVQQGAGNSLDQFKTVFKTEMTDANFEETFVAGDGAVGKYVYHKHLKGTAPSKDIVAIKRLGVKKGHKVVYKGQTFTGGMLLPSDYKEEHENK